MDRFKQKAMALLCNKRCDFQQKGKGVVYFQIFSTR